MKKESWVKKLMRLNDIGKQKRGTISSGAMEYWLRKNKEENQRREDNGKRK